MWAMKQGLRISSRASPDSVAQPLHKKDSPVRTTGLSVAEFIGGPPGDRTQDHLIKSQVLYH
jgi:hypothetical protein